MRLISQCPCDALSSKESLIPERGGGGGGGPFSRILHVLVPLMFPKRNPEPPSVVVRDQCWTGTTLLYTFQGHIMRIYNFLIPLG